MFGHRPGTQHGVRDPADALVGVLAGPAQQVRGLGRGEVMQCHQDPDRGGNPLMTGQHHTAVTRGVLEFIDPGGEPVVFHQCGGVIHQQSQQRRIRFGGSVVVTPWSMSMG